MKCFGAGHIHHCTVYEDNGLLIGLIVKQSEILLTVFLNYLSFFIVMKFLRADSHFYVLSHTS